MFRRNLLHQQVTKMLQNDTKQFRKTDLNTYFLTRKSLWSINVTGLCYHMLTPVNLSQNIPTHLQKGIPKASTSHPKWGPGHSGTLFVPKAAPSMIFDGSSKICHAAELPNKSTEVCSGMQCTYHFPPLECGIAIVSGVHS